MKGPHKRVLVIEDDDSTRAFIVLLLEDAGYEVRSAHEGAEGLISMCESRPDVIVLDVRMPVMDGWAFRRRQADLDGFGAIPTIMTSSGERPKSAELGSASFVPKPFSSLEMLDAIRSATTSLTLSPGT